MGVVLQITISVSDFVEFVCLIIVDKLIFVPSSIVELVPDNSSNGLLLICLGMRHRVSWMGYEWCGFVHYCFWFHLTTLLITTTQSEFVADG